MVVWVVLPAVPSLPVAPVVPMPSAVAPDAGPVPAVTGCITGLSDELSVQDSGATSRAKQVLMTRNWLKCLKVISCLVRGSSGTRTQAVLKSGANRFT
jgi:hypothetical protein